MAEVETPEVKPENEAVEAAPEEQPAEVKEPKPRAPRKPKEEAKGCETCNNTGLDGTGVQAQACPACGGSPFGAPKEDK